MTIGRLQSEADVERFVLDLMGQTVTGIKAQQASLIQGTQGAVLADSFATGEATSSATLTASGFTARPVLTATVAGTYVAFFGAEFSSASSVTPAVSLSLNGAQAGAAFAQTMDTPTGTGQISAFLPMVLAVGDVVGLLYRSQAAISTTFLNRRLALVRVSS